MYDMDEKKKRMCRGCKCLWDLIIYAVTGSNTTLEDMKHEHIQ